MLSVDCDGGTKLFLMKALIFLSGYLIYGNILSDLNVEDGWREVISMKKFEMRLRIDWLKVEISFYH